MIDTKPNTILIDVPLEDWNQGLWTVDCETDEQDNFVGVAFFNGTTCHYFTKLPPLHCVKDMQLIGHNLKADAKWLSKWGITIRADQMVMDTMLQSYVINSTKESHSLKDLAKEYLNLTWSTYKEMVHPDAEHPKKKVTLDKQDVSRVADYCASDAIGTWKLYQHFNRIMTPTQKRILTFIEMPVLRALYEMELEGIRIDTEYLSLLDKEYSTGLISLSADLQQMTNGQVNWRSPKQLLEFFKSLGYDLKDTQRKTLEGLTSCEFAQKLVEYKKLFKVHSTYIEPFKKLPTLPKVHTEFNQVVSKAGKDDMVGISTSRLSSRKPNLQNIPAKGETGTDLRKLFVAAKGHKLVSADYSQIEYRLLAHFTKEPRLMEAFRNGKDVHDETALALGVDRTIGKTLNFAAIYGAQEKRISETAGVSVEEAKTFLYQYWKVLPRVQAWINRTKLEAKVRHGVYTLMHRWIPIPGIVSSNPRERMHWERAAVNYIIQGSAAEIMKLALIELTKFGYKPLLTVHDEFVFEIEESKVPVAVDVIRDTMERIVKVDVPLSVEIGVGDNWNEAKE